MSIILLIYSLSKEIINNNISYIFLISLWISFEKLHLEWELSWPWLNLGNGLCKHNKWIQWYEYTGTCGGSLWILIVNIYIFNYSLNNTIKYFFKTNFLLNIILLIILPILISYKIYINYKEEGPLFEFIILQPNMNPYYNKYKTSDNNIINILLKLSNNKITKNTSFIIAPETAIPGNEKIFLESVYKNINISLIKKFLKKKSKIIFVSGIELISNKNINFYKKEKKIYNSVIKISSSQREEIYFKSKFVPGIEIIPYKKLFFPFIKKIILKFRGNLSELSIKKGNIIFNNDIIKFAPIICYESIFGEHVSRAIINGANYITIHTNDGWWGNSQGHKQHLYYSCLRAIENRRSIARSANTGISAFINQKGDIISSICYNKEDSIRKNIKFNNKKTFYTIYGDLIARIAIIINLIIIVRILHIFFYKKHIL